MSYYEYRAVTPNKLENDNSSKLLLSEFLN
jgi:hypothetical protein